MDKITKITKRVQHIVNNITLKDIDKRILLDDAKEEIAMTNKEIIYNYCKEKSHIDISHIENCISNLNTLSEDTTDYEQLEGCPSSYRIE